MKKLIIMVLCVSMICGLNACSNERQQDSNEDGTTQVIVVNSSSTDIYGIGYTYYVNGGLYTSGGCCYADNSAIKVGDEFSLEYQSIFEDVEKVEIELSVVNKSGTEYTCSSRISLATGTGTTYKIEVTGDYENGFCASVKLENSK